MPENESRLSELRKKLYRREGETARRERSDLTERGFSVSEEWDVPEEGDNHRSMSRKRRVPLNAILIGAGLFFIVSVALSAFFLFGDSVSVSARNIDITVEGPVSISAGDELSLQVTVTNRNAVPLTTADLLVEYPDGTRSAADVSKELPRHRESLGAVAPGEQINRTVRAALFGEAETTKEVRISLEYRVENSNAIFYKETVYEVNLSSVPLSLSVRALEETVSGQEINIVVTVSSNAGEVVRDALLSVDYPFGFDFIEATPEPSFSTDVWRLADIPPEGKRTVTIRGILTGQDQEERVFRFQSGIASLQNERALDAVLAAASHSIFIKRPFLEVNVAVNGETGVAPIVRAGKETRVDVTWRNNLATQITDAEITAKLSGDFHEPSVSANRGFYRSQDNTIVWGRDRLSELASVAPGDNGRVSFTFEPRASAAAENPSVTVAVSVSGRRISDANVPERIEENVARTARVATDLSLTSRAVHFVGPLVNGGPVPPRVEEETTYTIIWTVTNTTNDVSNAVVTATLPSYLEWLGVVDPGSDEVIYRPVGGEVRWNVGSVPARSGSPLEVAFQVALTPSLSQLGDTPVLVNNQRVQGTDVFAGVQVSDSAPPLSTELTTDPNFARGDGEVIQ